jgi:hypothetical protein
MMSAYPAAIEVQMQRYYQSLSEKDRRRYAGIEAAKLGHGGITYISRLLGCNERTVSFGMRELADEAKLKQSSIRQSGGGRKTAFEQHPGLDAVFLKVLSEHTAGSPMDEKVKWTNLNRPEIAKLLAAEGIEVSVTVVDQLLKKHHYRRRRARKELPTGTHPQRNEQFENIQQLKQRYQAAGNPVISMDTKKKN